MKHGSNPRRSRSRGGGNGKRHSSPRSNNFESNGPEVKVRGTAQQVLEKYLTLARDAYSAGDRVLSEGYFQFAEHYYRILNTDQGGANGQGRGNRGNGQGSRQNIEVTAEEAKANSPSKESPSSDSPYSDSSSSDSSADPEPASA